MYTKQVYAIPICELRQVFLIEITFNKKSEWGGKCKKF